MKRDFSLWQLAGFGFTALAGTLLHFLYDWTGQTTWSALISGVNESTWEHMKLLYVPLFLFAALLIVPFSASHVAAIDWPNVPVLTWWETGYVILFGTYISYILMMVGQRSLRPTVVSIYNYVQPIVSVAVSVVTGIGVFRWSHGIAVILVFSGVWLVTKSRSRMSD